MKKTISFLVMAIVLSAPAADAWEERGIIVNRSAAEQFAQLPDGVRFPEGIAVHPDTGEIFVATFDFGGNNKLLRFKKNGKLIAQKDFGATPLLGLAFNTTDGKVYICNAGDLVGPPYQSKIQRIPADFHAGTPIEEVALLPHIGPPPDRTVNNPDGSSDRIEFGNNASAPNAMAFQSDSSLFVSDSFQGAIFRIENADLCTGNCPVSTVRHDALFATAGFPPFGANGIAFSPDEKNLFIANTGDDRILRMDLETKTVEVFAESVDGADGIAFDSSGRLWVAANQADEVVVLNGNGQVIEKLGDFLGLRKNGAPRGLLFPASVVFSRDSAFVTNLALPLTSAVGDEPEEDVRVYTISRIKVPRIYEKHW
jgi:DNA-binding beta-propeller fold protein YncE